MLGGTRQRICLAKWVLSSVDGESEIKMLGELLWASDIMTVVCHRNAAQFARPPAKRAGGHSHGNLLESYSCRGRVAQLGEHLLCKHVRPFQRFLPLFCFSKVFNNFGESASRSK